MSLLEFAQFGSTIFISAVFFFAIREFLKFMSRQEENFKATIDNHLKENSKANQELSMAIKELLDYLRHQNSKR